MYSSTLYISIIHQKWRDVNYPYSIRVVIVFILCPAGHHSVGRGCEDTRYIQDHVPRCVPMCHLMCQNTRQCAMLTRHGFRTGPSGVAPVRHLSHILGFMRHIHSGARERKGALIHREIFLKKYMRQSKYGDRIQNGRGRGTSHRRDL